MTPQLIGDCIISGKDGRQKIFATISIDPNKKQTQQEAVVTRFEYSANKNGAKKAPASEPHDTPIN